MRIALDKVATIVAASALAAALAGCSQQNAPSDKIKQAADSIVSKVDGSSPTPAPKLAEGAYAPRDECQNTPGAEAFLTQLRAAVKARNTDMLAALAASDVQLNFGGGSGTGQLRAELSKHDWSLWDEFDKLMALGCGVNAQGGITLPWFETQDLSSVDATTAMMVVGEKVPIHSDAEAKSKDTEDISWDIVTLDGSLQPEDKYQKITTSDGTTGFIATDKLRSLNDYRLVASSRNGKWSFTSLSAGNDPNS
ncbi:hypothetical protein [Tsuneonella mangrovi]|uniref:hypothetical protein n=1 Tax=Tsuneonella mangrovi TaxID=1982042 RepID=UPI000BA265C9|nr:hypothetical protein [Tsuneonella mangrovi]